MEHYDICFNIFNYLTQYELFCCLFVNKLLNKQVKRFIKDAEIFEIADIFHLEDAVKNVNIFSILRAPRNNLDWNYAFEAACEIGNYQLMQISLNRKPNCDFVWGFYRVCTKGNNKYILRDILKILLTYDGNKYIIRHGLYCACYNKNLGMIHDTILITNINKNTVCDNCKKTFDKHYNIILLTLF